MAQSTTPADFGANIQTTDQPPLVPGTAGLTSKVVRGSLWTLTGQGLAVSASLISTPFVIRLLGAESYGLLALVSLVIGYLAFSDLGMGLASTRFGSEAYARGEPLGESKIIWTSLLIAVVPALIMVLMLNVAALPLVRYILRVPSYLDQTAILALRIASIGFFAKIVSSVLNTSLIVRLRMDLVTTINTSTFLIQAVLVPLVLFAGGGLLSAISVVTAVSISVAVLFALSSIWFLPSMLRPRVDTRLIKPLLSFGGAAVLSLIAVLVLVNGEKILLTRYASVTTLAYYSVAFTLAMVLTQVPGALTQSLLPAFSGLQAVSNDGSLRQLYIRALRGTLLWVAPATVLMCVIARPFLTIWAGPDFGRESTVPFYILSAGLVVNIMAFVPYTLLISLGRTGLIAKIHYIEVVPYLILAALLTRSFGAIGAAAAWSFRAAVTSTVFFMIARRFAGLRIPLLPITPWAFLISISALVLPVLILGVVSHSQVLRISVALGSLAAYAILVWSKVLIAEERAWVLALVRLHRLDKWRPHDAR